jgi:hypothetical protein
VDRVGDRVVERRQGTSVAVGRSGSAGRAAWTLDKKTMQVEILEEAIHIARENCCRAGVRLTRAKSEARC